MGYWVGNPGAGFLIGLASHVVLDVIPHEEFFGLKGELISSFLLSLVMLLLARDHVIGAFFGILGALLPDLEIALWQAGKLKKSQLLFPTHGSPLSQRESSSKVIKALQVLVIIASLVIVSLKSIG